MLGDDEAAMLMDRPPGGWSDLVTNQSLTAILDERFAAMEDRLDRRFGAIDRRFDLVDRRFDEVDHRFALVDQRFETQDYKLNSRMDQLIREQTWRLMTAVLTCMSILAALFGIMLVLTGR
jgi:hypothetical protein